MTVLVFSRCLVNGFVNFDDPDYVTDNPRVTSGLSADNIRWAFVSSHAANWHPLTWLSHMADCDLYGLRPWGHHLTSVLLHATNAGLLLLVLHAMTGSLWRSAFVAAVFALHPLRVESVAWVSERKDVLGGLFWMLTLAAYLGHVRRPGPLPMLGVSALFGLGLMAKPMLVTLPFVLLLLDAWPLGRAAGGAGGPASDWGRNPRSATVSGAPGATPAGTWGALMGRLSPWRPLVLEKTPLFLLAALSCAITYLAQQRGEAVLTLDQLPFLFRAANAVTAYAAYVGMTLAPFGLAVPYPHPGTTLSLPHAAFTGLLLAAVTRTILRLRERAPYLAVGWLWYLGTLVPVIGLLQVGGQAMADRYTYLPQIGLLVMLAWGVPDALAAWPRRRQALALAAGAALAGLALLTWRQAGFWRDSLTLHTRALACTTRNSVALSNLGEALDRAGQSREALACYDRAAAIAPASPGLHYNRGNALLKLGRPGEALRHYRLALASHGPRDLDALHSNMGSALEALGDFPAAAASFRQALALAPDVAMTHFNLGSVLGRLGQADEAILHLREACRLDPRDPDARVNLAIILAGSGQTEEAARCRQAALDLARAQTNAALVETLTRLAGAP